MLRHRYLYDSIKIFIDTFEICGFKLANEHT